MPSVAEGAQRRAAQADAGAVAAPAGVDLDQLDLGAALAQLDGRGHAGKAAADDQDASSLPGPWVCLLFG
jgi:hypothetical protein